MSKDQKRLDDYQPNAFYTKHAKKVKNGFSPFEVDGVPYFAYFQGGKLALLSQSYSSVNGRDNGIKSTTKNMKIADHYRFEKHKNGKYYYAIIAGNRQEVATSVWFASAKAAQTAADIMTGKRKPAPKSGRDVDNYHPLAFYERHATGKPDGIETFNGDDGLYYFTYNENGSIALISEGYPTSSARDKGAMSVVKNLPYEKRYSFKKLKNGKYDFRLKAGNHQEIARSRWYGGAAAAATGAAYLMGTRKRGSEAPIEKEDDYLKCAEYQGHPVNDKINNVAFFKHKNGQYYFVLYDAHGNVRLRSEGFRTAKQRDQELSGVVRLKDNEKYYKKIVKGDYSMDVLYDETGREVGRSCLRKKVAAPSPKATVAPVAAPAPKAAVAPVVAAAVPEATAAGGWGWLKWLLPLLALLLLALFGLKKCKPAAPVVVPPVVKKEVAPIKEVTPTPEPTPEPIPEPEPTPEPIPEPVQVAAAPTGLNICGPSTNKIFNVTSFMTPKPVDRLGTYPEFGDSHGLSASEFRNKLLTQAAISTFDARYLDYIATSMGYANFMDIPKTAFSEESLPYGTKGLLGFGEFHGFEYSELNTEARDLEAFRIEGANGQIVHYMKTCGNYMYACQ